MKIDRIIVDASQKFVKEIEKKGFISGGHNGPYYDDETPVRNTSHWLITFIHLYKLTGKNKYKLSANKCIEYLISEEARPMSAAFYCRKNPEKNFSNGLIGQAWVIEALVEAYKFNSKSEIKELALDVFNLHPFHQEICLWEKVNVDGSYNGVDSTFNHQLWFAAAGCLLSEICEDKSLEDKLNSFFDNLPEIVRINKDGLIKHKIILNNSPKKKIKNIFKKTKKNSYKIFKKRSMRYKEIGYHLFNLYGFALVRYSGTKLNYFGNSEFEKTINYICSNDYFEELEKNNYKNDYTYLREIDNDLEINRYGYAYNAPGFEYPFVYETFKKKMNVNNCYSPEDIFAKQLELTYNNESNLFSLNTEDYRTLSSRIYEVTRYSQMN